MAHEIETESLPAHVSICEERYKILEMRMKNVEVSIEKLQELIRDVHKKIDNIGSQHNRKWDATQVAAISLLLCALGFAISRII